MTFLAPHKVKAAELELILARWENRWELRQLTRSLPRALIAAAMICLVAGAAGYLQFGLRTPQLALMTGVICGAAVVLNLVTTLLFPRTRVEQARHFDLEFGLRERLSTALELMSGRLTTSPEIESRQIEDALFYARQINAVRAIELDWRRRELALLSILSLALALLIAMPLIGGERFIQGSSSPAVAEAQEDLREMIEAVATDSDLADSDRRELLDALEVALERLEAEDISDEEAFAAISQLQAQLESTEQALDDTIDLDQTALAEALEALDDFLPPSTAENTIEADADLERLADALENMMEGLEDLSAAEAAAIAEALENASDALDGMNQQLSENMAQMAQSLSDEALDEMRRQMQEAMAQIEQEQDQQQQNQDARQMLMEQSELAQEAAEDIAQQQAQRQMPSPDAGAPEDAGDDGRQGNQLARQAEDGSQQGNQQGNMPMDENRPGSQRMQVSSQDSRGAGAGAGEGEADNRSLAGAAGEDQGVSADNRTSGARQIEYEAIYSPHGISGGGIEELRLRGDAGDQTLGEGDFDDNPLGEARVSYDTVFSDYQNAANRALESDYVPLGLRDVVREYFTSLQPQE